jgi:cell division protease FtsH
LQKILRNGAFYFLILILALWLIQGTFLSSKPPKKVSFDKFIKDVEAGKVAQVKILDSDKVIEATYKNGSKIKSSYPENYDIAKKLLSSDVKVEVEHKNMLWLSILLNVAPWILLIFLWIFMLQQMQGSGNKVLSFGKSRARKFIRDYPAVTFKDVAGLDEAIEEMQEIKEYLTNPSKFQAMGARVPKGLLLYGPPGCGKTLLARAVAGEARVPFFSISGSEFVEMFVGVGASRVRDLFEQAKAHAPAIVFIDEIDAVGRHRGAGLGGGHDEREQTLNELLVQMDGFDVNDNIIVIAATNRPDILDPALLRPGRFDRHIAVDAPDLKGRLEILKVHTKNKPLAKNVKLDVLAKRTPGFTGADLANLVNEAAILSARHGKKKIDMKELEEAIDRVIAGPEKKTKVISEREKTIIAYHEAGHALVAHFLPEANPVHKISIIPRGRALGYTLTLPDEDRYLVTKNELMDQLAVLLGGRVAETLVFGDVTTGAQDDLDKATKIARKMVCEYGMSEKLGPLTLGHREEVFLGKDIVAEPNYSPEIAYEIDKEIRRIVEDAFERAKQVLTEHSKELELVAVHLKEKETLDKEQLEQLLEKGFIEETLPSEEEKEEAKEKEKVKSKVPPIPGKLRPVEG